MTGYTPPSRSDSWASRPRPPGERSELPAGHFQLPPGIDLRLQPIDVVIPEQFSHLLPHTLSVNLPPGFSARVFAAFEDVRRPRFMAFGDEAIVTYYTRGTDWARDAEIALEIYEVDEFYR